MSRMIDLSLDDDDDTGKVIPSVTAATFRHNGVISLTDSDEDCAPSAGPPALSNHAEVKTEPTGALQSTKPTVRSHSGNSEILRQLLVPNRDALITGAGPECSRRPISATPRPAAPAANDHDDPIEDTTPGLLPIPAQRQQQRPQPCISGSLSDALKSLLEEDFRPKVLPAAGPAPAPRPTHSGGFSCDALKLLLKESLPSSASLGQEVQQPTRSGRSTGLPRQQQAGWDLPPAPSNRLSGAASTAVLRPTRIGGAGGADASAGASCRSSGGKVSVAPDGLSRHGSNSAAGAGPPTGAHPAANFSGMINRVEGGAGPRPFSSLPSEVIGRLPSAAVMSRTGSAAAVPLSGATTAARGMTALAAAGCCLGDLDDEGGHLFKEDEDRHLLEDFKQLPQLQAKAGASGLQAPGGSSRQQQDQQDSEDQQDSDWDMVAAPGGDALQGMMPPAKEVEEDDDLGLAWLPDSQQDSAHPALQQAVLNMQNRSLGGGGVSSERRGLGVKVLPGRAAVGPGERQLGRVAVPVSPIEADSPPETLSGAATVPKKQRKRSAEDMEAAKREKETIKEEKRLKKEEDRVLKSMAVQQEKRAKNAQKEITRALKGTDGEKRIRVKFSAAAATTPWYCAALKAVDTWFQTVASGGAAAAAGTASQPRVCEVPVNPPLPMSRVACVRWTRSMPGEAASVLENSQGGGAEEALARHREAASGDVEVPVPLVLVVLSPEELVDQIVADRLGGLVREATRHHPDCTLQVATYGLDNYLARKQKQNAGFNANVVNDLLMDLHMCPTTSALHLRADLKDEAHLALFIADQTRVIARDLQKRGHEGYLSSFCRKGEGLEALLPKGGYEESTRTFARALMQNCLLDKDKAATVAARWGSLGGLMDAYANPALTDRQRKELLVGSKISGDWRTLGVLSSTAVFNLLARKDPEERVDRVDLSGGPGKKGKG